MATLTFCVCFAATSARPLQASPKRVTARRAAAGPRPARASLDRNDRQQKLSRREAIAIPAVVAALSAAAAAGPAAAAAELPEFQCEGELVTAASGRALHAVFPFSSSATRHCPLKPVQYPHLVRKTLNLK